MNKEIRAYVYGFTAGILLTAFVATLTYAVCVYYCDQMLDELLSRGAVPVVPDTVQHTQP